MQLGRWGRPFVSPRGLRVPSCMGWSTGSNPLLSRTARANDDWGEGRAPSPLSGPVVDCGGHVGHTRSGFEQRSSEQCRSSWLSACCRGSSWLGGRMLAGSAPQDSVWCLLSEVEKELGVISMHVVHPKDSPEHQSFVLQGGRREGCASTPLVGPLWVNLCFLPHSSRWKSAGFRSHNSRSVITEIFCARQAHSSARQRSALCTQLP